MDNAMIDFNYHDREHMTSVTKGAPCEVCGGDHKCSRGDEGLIICGREDGPVSGFHHLGPAKGDDQFHLFRLDDGTDPPAAIANSKPKPKPKQPQGARDWGAEATRFAKCFTLEARAELASRLGLPPAVFALMPLIGVSGHNDLGRTFTFPECDATGKVIGLTERIPEGGGKETKKMRSGGHRGLTIPTNWKVYEGPVCPVEGPSDTLAMTAAGLAALGRPSNTGCRQTACRRNCGCTSPGPCAP